MNNIKSKYFDCHTFKSLHLLKSNCDALCHSPKVIIAEHSEGGTAPLIKSGAEPVAVVGAGPAAAADVAVCS